MLLIFVQVGMRLLEVNGISLLGASHQEAVNALRSSGQKIHIVVCKGKLKKKILFSKILL
jgi:protein scribble